MKDFISSFILCFLMSMDIAAANSLSYPKIFFRYSSLYDDTVCPKKPVPTAWASEAKTREKEFSNIWEKDAPSLLGRVLADFGVGFSRTELTATLTACTESWSYSDPLVLRVLNFLKSYMGAKPVWEDYAFSNQVFHELLHVWLVDNFTFSSPLLTKYKSEPYGVRAHLHLMAIQKQVYLELGRKDLLDWISLLYPNMKRGGEPRAWEIVNNIEDYKTFIAEVKGP